MRNWIASHAKIVSLAAYGAALAWTFALVIALRWNEVGAVMPAEDEYPGSAVHNPAVAGLFVLALTGPMGGAAAFVANSFSAAVSQPRRGLVIAGTTIPLWFAGLFAAVSVAL